MTKLLEKAFAQAQTLPPAELRTDAQWEKSFDNSLEMIKQLEADAISEHAQGKTTPLNIDRLT